MKILGTGLWCRGTAFALFAFSCWTMAQQQDIQGPSGSNAFGTTVTVLSNGNIVVTDPGFSTDTTSAVGAVYLFSPEGVLISKLTGSTANDRVGNGGVFVLQNGNYVISSFTWSNSGVANAGAATWASATVGVTGTVSQSNSLVGTHIDDQVSLSRIAALANGNYAVASPYWNGELGAATWGNGATGTHGIVAAANSLIGNSIGDHISLDGIFPLTNGDYVVASSNWQLSIGAATWCDGAGSTSAKALATNSLVGSNVADFIAVGGITPLPGGNYVVHSPYWQNGQFVQAGAATWVDITGGIVGPVTSTNSLVGTHTTDWVGFRVIALANGNYLVNSPDWSNQGAVTWADGSKGITGEVSDQNSFMGSGTILPLNDGNFVVVNEGWTNGDVYAGGTAGVGAVTWGNGSQPFLGEISGANSLIGTHYLDEVGYGGVAALTGGRYVIGSSHWNGWIGAVTLAGGIWPVTGVVSATNSITGYTDNYIGGAWQMVTALSDGNYVVTSEYQNGLVAWESVDAGTSGTISPDNALINTWNGVTVTPTSNSNWILFSPHWTTNQVTSPNRGAVTLVHGGHQVSGSVGASNSVLGGVANGAAQITFGYDASRDHLVVGRPAENLLTIFDGNIVFSNGFD